MVNAGGCIGQKLRYSAINLKTFANHISLFITFVMPGRMEILAGVPILRADREQVKRKRY